MIRIRIRTKRERENNALPQCALVFIFFLRLQNVIKLLSTVCPGSNDPPEKILNIFASEIEVYTIF